MWENMKPSGCEFINVWNIFEHIDFTGETEASISFSKCETIAEKEHMKPHVGKHETQMNKGTPAIQFWKQKIKDVVFSISRFQKK